MKRNEKKITVNKTLRVLLTISLVCCAILAIKGMVRGDGELTKRGCILTGMTTTFLAANECCLSSNKKANSNS